MKNLKEKREIQSKNEDNEGVGIYTYKQLIDVNLFAVKCAQNKLCI